MVTAATGSFRCDLNTKENKTNIHNKSKSSGKLVDTGPRALLVELPPSVYTCARTLISDTRVIVAEKFHVARIVTGFARLHPGNNGPSREQVGQCFRTAVQEFRALAPGRFDHGLLVSIHACAKDPGAVLLTWHVMPMPAPVLQVPLVVVSFR